MSNQHNFQVDLRGVIELLSKHLYSGPQVYIREMLQNAVDAIVARRAAEPALAGEIRLELIGEAASPTLLVTDNGIGLTEDEVHQFLSTIGQSSKRGEAARQNFIGQFGIGLLSGFLVCEEIVVITQSAKQPDSPAVEWRGRDDGTYSLRQLDRTMEPGTQVYLRAKPGCADFFDFDFVEQTARRYGELLEFPIQLSAGERRTYIQENPPWRVDHGSGPMWTEAALRYGKRLFDVEFFDAIPIDSPTGGVRGIAFVLPFTTGLARKQSHRVYLKGMLLSEQTENVLPNWAFFTQCVLDATNLRPTASREALVDDETLDTCRDELAACLRSYLLNLAKADDGRLMHLIGLHHLAIKSLALEDDELFEMFIDWIPFETSLGGMTLAECEQHSRPIQFVPTVDQFRQISTVAAAQTICVVNAGHTFEKELLARLPFVNPDRRVEQLDVSELSQNFTDLTLDERERVFNLIKIADLALQPFHTAAEVKKFQPNNLPVLYSQNDAASFVRSVEQTQDVADDLWSGVLDRISENAAGTAYAQLCFNFENALVRQLAAVTDRDLLRRVIELLYAQSLMLGQFPMKAAEMSLMTTGLLDLIQQCVAAKSDGEGEAGDG